MTTETTLTAADIADYETEIARWTHEAHERMAAFIEWRDANPRIESNVRMHRVGTAEHAAEHAAAKRLDIRRQMREAQRAAAFEFWQAADRQARDLRSELAGLCGAD